MPLHPESEAEGTILDPLKCGDVSGGSKGEGEWTICEKRKNEGFIEMKFCFLATAAKSLQAAQCFSGYGILLFYMYVKSKVLINGESKHLVVFTDRYWNWVWQEVVE